MSLELKFCYPCLEFTQTNEDMLNTCLTSYHLPFPRSELLREVPAHRKTEGNYAYTFDLHLTWWPLPWETNVVLTYKRPYRNINKNPKYSDWITEVVCSSSVSLPFEMSTLLSLLHWDTEELSKNDLCLPNRRGFLGQSGVTPASPTFSPTGVRRIEKFIPQFTLIAKKTTHSPMLWGQNSI